MALTRNGVQQGRGEERAEESAGGETRDRGCRCCAAHLRGSPAGRRRGGRHGMSKHRVVGGRGELRSWLVPGIDWSFSIRHGLVRCPAGSELLVGAAAAVAAARLWKPTRLPLQSASCHGRSLQAATRRPLTALCRHDPPVGKARVQPVPIAGMADRSGGAFALTGAVRACGSGLLAMPAEHNDALCHMPACAGNSPRGAQRKGPRPLPGERTDGTEAAPPRLRAWKHVTAAGRWRSRGASPEL